MDNKKLERLLREAQGDTISPSVDFESRFYKVLEHRRQSPWFLKWFGDLQVLVPAPMATSMAASLLVVFLVGGATGTVFTMGERRASASSSPAAQSLSGLQEFKGMSSVSVTAAYLKVSERGQIL